MTDYAYAPGDWTALAHGGRAALLDPAVPAEEVTRIWESLSGDGNLESWLEVLAGHGLAGLPGFGLIEPGADGVRIVVRGDVVALVGDYDVSAGGMRTWREHVVPESTGVTLQVQAGDRVLPLVGGVVLASSLQVGDAVPTTQGSEGSGAAVTAEGADDAEPAPAGSETGSAAPDATGTPDGDVEGAEVVEATDAAPVVDEDPDAHDWVADPGTGEETVEGENEGHADQPDAEQTDLEQTDVEQAGDVAADLPPSGEPADVEQAGEQATDEPPADPVAADVAPAEDGDAAAHPLQAPADPWHAPDAQPEQAEEPWHVQGEDASAEAQGPHGPEAAAELDAAASADPLVANGLIDSLPWNVPGAAPAVAPAAAPTSADLPAPADDGEHDGRTERPGSPGPADGGDHDGRTERPWEAGRHREDVAGLDGPVVDAGDHDGHTVLVGDLPSRDDAAEDATIAPYGDHEVREHAVVVPSLHLALSTGQQLDLATPVLIGRAPEAPRFGGDEVPQLVTVPSPQQDISRTHVEVRADGDHVLVTDLRSTNGTVVVLPGAPPRRLHPGESVPVPATTVIDLGDGVTAVVAEPPTPMTAGF